MNAHPPHLDLTLLLPPDLAAAIDDADRILRARIELAEDLEPAPPPRTAASPVVVPLGPSARRQPLTAVASPPPSGPPPGDPPTALHHDVRAAATLVRIRKTAADFLLRHPELLPPGDAPPPAPHEPDAPQPPGPAPPESSASTSSTGSTSSTRSTGSTRSTLSTPSSASAPRSPWRTHPAPPLPPPRARRKKRLVPYRPLPFEAPLPDPAMAQIIAGELHVLPDGRLVPAVEPGARAPLADLHEMLSERLADEVAAATLDLRDALPNHVLSRNVIHRPAGFARDVERLARLVSLHVTLAEITLAKSDLTPGLEHSPLARFSPYDALALQLPAPPAEKLDAFLERLALDPESEDAAGPFEPDGARSASAFSIPECLDRIRAALPALRDLDPRRALRSGLAPRFDLRPVPASAGLNSSGSIASVFSGPARQPSLAVLAPLSLSPAALPRALGTVGFDRFSPAPLAPRAWSPWLHELLAATALVLLFRRSGRPVAPAGFAPLAHAPP